MKTFAVLFIVLLSLDAYGQGAVIENGMAKYKDFSYRIGDTVKIGYGSDVNREFSFIYFGNAVKGRLPMNRSWAKSEVIINKFFVNNGKVYMRARLRGNSVYIDLECAVDNQEIIKPD